MSNLTPLIEQHREAYAESLRTLLTDSAAAVSLVRDAAKTVYDELKERNESKED